MTKYKKAQRDVLWISSGAIFDGTKAIRGGIPLVFPQFGPKADEKLGVPSMKQHGFARISKWAIAATWTEECKVSFRLSDSETTRELWPFKFDLLYTVQLTKEGLRTELKITNVDTKPMHPQALLHTYYAAANVTSTEVQGLEAHSFFDQLSGETHVQSGSITFKGETDLIFHGGALQGPKQLSIPSAAAITVDATAVDEFGETSAVTPLAPDVVVWNPHIAKARSMADFDDDGWTSMLCVEPGILASDRAPIQPGNSLVLGQTIHPSF